jgi:signal recognition particle GTPase
VIAGDGVDMFKEEGFEIIIVDTSGTAAGLSVNTIV